MSKGGGQAEKKPYRLVGGQIVTVVLFLILVGGSIGLGMYADATKPDLNVDIPIVNSEWYSIWNGTDEVFWMSRVINATSNYGETIVFWVNTSQYGDTRFVDISYFNGTHGDDFNASEPHPQRSWNYRQWWTDYRRFWRDDFNITTSEHLTLFTIPRQKGDTTVIYQLSISVWNGTGLEFTNYTETFVVRYSDYEVSIEQRIYVTTGLYWASHFILIGLLFVAWRIHKPEKETESKPKPRKDEEKHHLDESLLIARSNHLDGTIGGLRTGATFLLGIGTGATLWLGNVAPSYQWYFFFGLFSFSICSLLSIVLTFSSSKVRKDGFELKRGLIPSGQTPDEYRDHLEHVVTRKEAIIERIESFIGVGLIYLGTFLLMGFIVSIFPASDILGDRIWSMIPVWTASGLAFLDSFAWSAVVLGPRGLGVVEWFQ